VNRSVAAALIIVGAAGIYLTVLTSVIPDGLWRGGLTAVSLFALTIGIIRPRGPWRTR
jgi:hypothetical protein